MNAGAEYVAYRIWATLQDQNGIHAGSLLTCLGALAGYACQAYARHARVDVPLTESPLSVWALVGLEVRKLGKPLPDLQEIRNHVAQADGTNALILPRIDEQHRPRHPPIVYLKQIWPQILPIAQRFCSKPMQIPVLFGIALQRAIEQTQHQLDPTLGASLAMECAVAMSKAVLPELTVAPINSGMTAYTTGGQAAEVAAAPAAPARKRRNRDAEEVSAPRIMAALARFPPAARIVTIMFLAFITVAGVMHEPGRRVASETVRAERAPIGPQSEESMRVAQLPTRDAQEFPDALQNPESVEEPQPSEDAPVTEAENASAEAPAAEAANEGSVDDVQPQPQTLPEGYDEMVIRE